MPDTTNITSPQDLQRILDSLPPDIRPEVEKILHQTTQQHNFFQDNFTSIIFFLALALYTFVSVRRGVKQKDADVTRADNPIESASNRLMFYGSKLKLTDEEINNILSKYHSYFSNLQPTLQIKFTERLKQFIHRKIFIVCDKEQCNEMAVLISAAAIQITFGLDNFLLPWFEIIQVHAEGYVTHNCPNPLAGHVQGNIITVAWNSFIKGYANQSDGDNVGIHEMAHALFYQEIIVDVNKEKDFKEYYDKVMEESKKIYSLRETQRELYNEYAFINLQEFWAESLEIFFEEPESMQAAYYDLFVRLKQLLLQDPINKSNPLLIN